ncbi:MAG: hypothetical protein OXD29_03390 [Roseovarius sp.]|nr:hypothetical protein [Roseovarius sp.]MCY4206980.1 hypothetical protein [Roseovarius sp.]MCY4317442.1 hypothetical protein [Roseovarius sp.]
MRIPAGMLLIVFLAGCGVDGEPVRPTISGSISAGTSDVSVSSAVTVARGSLIVGSGRAIIK